jgi:ectoine hydroxylase-related dioxygenase (phytanoyl-CoA dioxygenase family)
MLVNELDLIHAAESSSCSAIVQSLRDHGVVVVRNALPRSAMNEIADLAASWHATRRARAGAGLISMNALRGGTNFENVEFGGERFAYRLFDLVRTSIILECFKGYLGCDALAVPIWHALLRVRDVATYKAALPTYFDFHQDGASPTNPHYGESWPANFWTSLTPIDDETWPLSFVVPREDALLPRPVKMDEYLASGGRQVWTPAFGMGDVALFTYRTIHGSRLSKPPTRRASLEFRVGPASRWPDAYRDAPRVLL